MEAFHVCHIVLGSVGDQSPRNDEWKAGVDDCRGMTLEGENDTIRVELLKRITDGKRFFSND